MQIPLSDASRSSAVICRYLLRVFVIAMVLYAFPAIANSDIAAIQSRLKGMGLYYGESDGKWGDETSAAVTRYQIRQGLEINGQLTAETLEALGLAENGAPPNEEQPRGDAWRILREQDTTDLEDLPPEPELGRTQDERPARNTIASVPPRSEKPSQNLQGSSPSPTSEKSSLLPEMPSPAIEAPAPPEAMAPRAEAVPPRAAAVAPGAVARSQPQQSPGAVTQDQLRDYIGAYVLAGLSPSVEPELEFFANTVQYFGKGGVRKEMIRRDLEQYNAQYPHRRFWLAGDPQIQSQTDQIIRVDFPLRFEVSGTSGRRSGKVLKSVSLRKTGHSLEIIAVDEKRMN